MFKDWLKRERESRSLTQGELGALIGTSGAYVQHMEAGRRRPGLDIMEGLARVFGLTIEQIRAEVRMAPETFPAEQLRREGLPEHELDRYARYWARYPADREALLESAHDLARAYAKQQQLITKLHTESGDAPEVNSTTHPVAS